MAILLVLPFQVVLWLATVLFAVRRRFKLATTCLFLTVVLNIYAEIVPLHFIHSSHHSRADMSVLTYNVCCFGKAYKESQASIAKGIISEQPDVVFLCEFYLSRSVVLDSIMRDVGGYTRYYEPGTCGVFYSKYPIDSIVGIYSKESKKRYKLNNMVHVIVGNDTLTVVGCHLSSSNHHIRKGYENRAEESDAIYEAIKGETYPVIVMGDMNDISGSYSIRRIQETGLADAWWKGGFGYGTTYHDKWLRLRLDHILYQHDRLQLQEVKVVDSDLSDHYALSASFRIKHE